jgi:hypothetical protein
MGICYGFARVIGVVDGGLRSGYWCFWAPGLGWLTIPEKVVFHLFMLGLSVVGVFLLLLMTL